MFWLCVGFRFVFVVGGLLIYGRDDMSIFGVIKDVIFGYKVEVVIFIVVVFVEVVLVILVFVFVLVVVMAEEIDVCLVKIVVDKGVLLNYKMLIVDLMKLFNFDLSLGNCIELVKELGYIGDINDFVMMNIWFYGEVMKSLVMCGV